MCPVVDGWSMDIMFDREELGRAFKILAATLAFVVVYTFVSERIRPKEASTEKQ